MVINHGNVVLNGALEQLAAQGELRVLARTDVPDQLVAAVRDEQANANQAPDGLVEITGLSPRQVFQIAAARGIALDELTSRQRSLDDIYREAVGHAPSAPMPIAQVPVAHGFIGQEDS